jgi:hypothetical protein
VINIVKKKCEYCGDCGWFLTTQIEHDLVCVERCDDCKKIDSDAEAGAEFLLHYEYLENVERLVNPEEMKRINAILVARKV